MLELQVAVPGFGTILFIMRLIEPGLSTALVSRIDSSWDRAAHPNICMEGQHDNADRECRSSCSGASGCDDKTLRSAHHKLAKAKFVTSEWKEQTAGKVSSRR